MGDAARQHVRGALAAWFRILNGQDRHLAGMFRRRGWGLAAWFRRRWSRVHPPSIAGVSTADPM